MQDKPRTLKQNDALHLMLENLAQQLNDAGLDMRKTLKPTINILWSKESAKEYIFRPIMKAQFGISSTTQLTTKQVNAVYETIARHFAKKFGLVIDFPSIESLMMNERTKL